MIHALIELDRYFLLLINGMNNPWMDRIMYIVSDRLTWVPLYLFLIYFLIQQENRIAWLPILAAIFTIVLTDQISVNCFKDVFLRPRPTHHPIMGPLMHTVNDYRGGLYGFISSHAANSFGLAAIVSLIIPDRRLRIFIFIWATIVSYSRIYLGVHYPADVSVGAIVGLISARIVYLGYTKLYSLVKQKTQSKPLKNT